MAADSEDDTAGLPPPPPSYASLSSPLVPQHGFQQPEHVDGARLHPAFDHAYGDSLNLPAGFFIVRNAAQGKALDLLAHRQSEGSELGLHPVKQPQLKGLSLQHTGSNQLFFVDWAGHLVSASASREIDVEDNRLVLAFPHPIAKYASSLSHPPPCFRLDPSTSTLHVVYSHDPSITGTDDSSDWRDDDYIVEAVPIKRKPAEPPLWATTQANQLLSAVGSRAANLGARVGGLLGGRFSQPSSPNPAALERRESSDEPPLPPPPPPEKRVEKQVPPVPSTSELPDLPASGSSAGSPLDTEDDSATTFEHDSDSDTEPSAFRPVRVVRLEPHWRDKFPSAALRTAPNTSFGVTRWPTSAKELRKWRRRQWDVVPVTVHPLPASAAEGFLLPSPGGSDSAPRSRSNSVSLFGGDSAGSGEPYDPTGDGDDEEDATCITSRDFSPLRISSPARMGESDLPLPPSPTSSGAHGAAAAQFSGSPLPSTPTQHRPLPPSPPLPSVPLASAVDSAARAAGIDEAEGDAELKTPRPDQGPPTMSGSPSRAEHVDALAGIALDNKEENTGGQGSAEPAAVDEAAASLGAGAVVSQALDDRVDGKEEVAVPASGERDEDALSDSAARESGDTEKKAKKE